MIMEMDKVQFGVASWYGNEFQGCTTSSGEKYDKDEFTGAHRALPFGTCVKVTNIKNGRSVVVRINDRGPHKLGRKIDLSYAAADKIDMVRDGVARVKIDVLDEVEGALSLNEQKTLYSLPLIAHEQYLSYSSFLKKNTIDDISLSGLMTVRFR